MYNIGISTTVVANQPTKCDISKLTQLSYELESYFDAVLNLHAINESLKKYGKTSQLTDLVGSSFESAGITLSNEGIVDAIKDFFKWIWDKIKGIWDWIKGLFSSSKNVVDKAKQDAAAIKSKVNETDQQAASGHDDPKTHMNLLRSFEELQKSFLIINIPDVKKLDGMFKELETRCGAIPTEGMTTTAPSNPHVVEVLDKIEVILNEMIGKIDDISQNHVNISVSPRQASEIAQRIAEALDRYKQIPGELANKIKQLERAVATAERLFSNNPDSEKFKTQATNLKRVLKLIPVLAKMYERVQALLVKALAIIKKEVSA